ncbi:LrgB family protein [Staphylococcus aureus]
MNPFLNPALIASLGIIFVFTFILGISYNGYMKGGSWINHILNATVVC